MKTLLKSDYFQCWTNKLNLFSIDNILFGKTNPFLYFRLDIIREVENQIELEHQININSNIYQFYISSYFYKDFTELTLYDFNSKLCTGVSSVKLWKTK